MNKMQTNLETYKSEKNVSISILKEGRQSNKGVLWNSTSYDVGYGALAARVIRPVFDSRRMDYCVEQMKEVPNEPIVGHRRLADLLNKLEYGLTLLAPVIKCKKTPRKKCRFVAERRKKR